MLEWIAKIEMQERLGVLDVPNQFGDQTVNVDYHYELHDFAFGLIGNLLLLGISKIEILMLIF